MIRILLFLVVVMMVVPVIATGADKKPDKALCPVCAVNGETEMEKIKGEAEHEGKMYYFCSEKCAAEFRTDPVGYLPAKLPRPAPAFVVETLDGRDVAASEFEGKIVSVNRKAVTRWVSSSTRVSTRSARW